MTEINVTSQQDGSAGAEPSLGQLFKELANESTTLMKQEVALAKAELRENASAAAKDVGMAAAGGGLVLVGLLALTAFLVALLGDIFGDEYWLGALIIGLIYVIIGAVMAKKAMANLRREGLKPDQTIQTLKEDQRWIKSEIQQAKQDLT